jgi:tRNA-dihydrouridine synthase B
MKKKTTSSGFWEKLKRPFTGLSPMDGVTDAPFRFITAKYGKPDVIFTEFTPVEGISAGAVKPLYSLIYDKSERPVVAQFFGKTPDGFYKAAMIASELGFDGIDINMGCPAKNIAGKGCGAGLIIDPPLAKKIIRETKRGALDWAEGRKLDEIGLPGPILEYIAGIKRATRSRTRKILPVSVKTRLGYEKNIAVEWVKHLLEESPAAITVHGRTFRQGYSGNANWEAIADTAQLIHKTGTIAIGNGDVKSVDEAREKARQYGVDGVLLGRAALGNPWVFADKMPDIRERFRVASEHAKKYSGIFGRGYFSPMKKHLAWYCRGFPGAAATRQALMKTETFEEVEGILKETLARSK